MIKIATLVLAVLAAAGPAWSQSLLKQGREAGSAGGGSLYDAPRRLPFRKHDLVRIQVTERSRAQASTDLRTDRRSRFEVDLTEWIKFDSKNKNLPDLKASPLEGDPGIDLDGRFRHDNLGRTTRQSDFTFTITAEVIDIRPNGNLVLQAKKRRKVNAETETIKLTGVVDPDVVVNGMVRSENVANLDLTFEGNGTVGDPTKPGILGWLLQKLWPF